MKAVYRLRHFNLPGGFTTEKLGYIEAEDMDQAVLRQVAPLVNRETPPGIFSVADWFEVDRPMIDEQEMAELVNQRERTGGYIITYEGGEHDDHGTVEGRTGEEGKVN